MPEDKTNGGSADISASSPRPDLRAAVVVPLENVGVPPEPTPQQLALYREIQGVILGRYEYELARFQRGEGFEPTLPEGFTPESFKILVEMRNPLDTRPQTLASARSAIQAELEANADAQTRLAKIFAPTALYIHGRVAHAQSPDNIHGSQADEKKKEPKRVGGVAVPFSVDREASERHRVIPLESHQEYMNGTRVDISHGITYDIVSEGIGERVTGYEMVLSEHAHPENTAAIRLVFDDYNEVVGVDISWNPRHKWLHFYNGKTKPILFTFLDSKGEKAKNFLELLALRRWIGGEGEFFIHDEEYTLHINIREKDEEYPDGMVVTSLERLVGKERLYSLESGYTEGRGKISWTGGANYPYNASLGEFQPVKVPGYDVDFSGGQPLKLDLVEGALREIVDLFPNPGSQHFAMPNK